MLNMKEFCRERWHILFSVFAALVAVGVMIVVFSTVSCSAQPTQSDPASEPQQSAALSDTTEAESDAAPSFYSVLSGLPCTEAQSTVRPVGIMINNIAAALPQIGISKADIIYECEVEGGLTRLFALFSDWADIDSAIGSVRSAREYFIDFAANHDAIFVHAGGSEEAYSQLQSRKTDHIDGVNGNATGYFYRDPDRLATMSYEHTLVITGKSIAKAAAFKGYRTTLDTAYQSPFRFAGVGEVITPDEGAATHVTTPYNSYQYADFTYDTASAKYLRSQRGEKQLDGDTGAQLSFDNVIVLFCPYAYTGDDKGHITVDTVGSGSGYYITRGHYETVQWSKTGADAPMTLTGADGQQLIINSGKTFISVMNSTRVSAVTLN